MATSHKINFVKTVQISFIMGFLLKQIHYKILP